MVNVKVSLSVFDDDDDDGDGTLIPRFCALVSKSVSNSVNFSKISFTKSSFLV